MSASQGKAYYDSTTKVWIEQAGVRVVRHAAAVQVSGATGPAAATINGVYRPVAEEGVGGKPVYKKDGLTLGLSTCRALNNGS